MNMVSSYGKEFSLCSIFVFLHAVTFWMWYRVMPLIAEGDFEHYGTFVLPVVLLLGAAMLFSLAALLVRDTVLLIGTMTVAASVPYFFSISVTGIAFGALVATVLLLPFAAALIRKEVAGSLSYRIPRFLKQGLGFYFTAAALVLSFFYLNRIDDQKVFSLLFPQPVFDFVVRSFSGTIQEATGLPPIRPEQTINEIMAERIRIQLQSQGLSLAGIPQQELNRMLAAQRTEFAKVYRITIGGEEKIGAVFVNAVTTKVKDLIGEYNRYLPLGAAIAFFFMIKAVSILLLFLSLALVVLLMKLLVLAKVVRKEKKQIEVERLVL